MAHWRDVYAMEKERVGQTIPTFTTWLKEAVLISKDRRICEDDVVHSLVVGPSKKTHFYSPVNQNGKHFRVFTRDTQKKNTYNSRILAYFDVGMGEKIPFYGVLADIVHVRYGKYDQILFKGMWYDNKGTRSKASTIVLTNECGITCVKATPMPYKEKVTFDPFVIPEWAIQVSYI